MNKKLSKYLFIIFFVFLLILSSCKKNNEKQDDKDQKENDNNQKETIKYNVEFYDIDNQILETKVVLEGSKVESVDYHVVGYKFINWHLENSNVSFDFNNQINDNIKLYPTLEKLNTYIVEFYNLDKELLDTKVVEENSKVEAIDYKPTGYKFINWHLENKEEAFDFNQKINNNIKLYPTLEAYLDFNIKGNKSVLDGSITRYTVEFEEDSLIADATFSIINPSRTDLCIFSQVTKSNCRIEAMHPGTYTLQVDVQYKDIKKTKTIDITILGAKYNINYELEEAEKDLLPLDAPNSYNTADLPFNLPILVKEDYFFMGWKTDISDDCYKVLDEELFNNYPDLLGDLDLKPVWIFPHLNVSYKEKDSLIGIGEEIELVIENIDIPEEWLEAGYNYTSNNAAVATINNGKAKGLSEGYTELAISLVSHPSVNITIGLTVTSDVNNVDELLKYFAEINSTPIISKNIDVITWQQTWKYDLLTSVSPYLFEPLDIVENIAPMGYSRPGTIKQKYYVCVHDTADLAYGAKKWSETVYNKQYDNGDKYEASFQYVVGNDGIYHNIPDNEVAWHAGDGTATSYSLKETNVFGTNKYPTIGISEDGYYTIDGVKSIIVAPTDNSGHILQSKAIVDSGITCKLIDGQYYMGPSYYNSSYRRISNLGGNNNSIGIESCVNANTDVFYTWQKLAKLVAYLLDNNDLTTDDVVQHHYFSGKDCPITMRHSDMWNYFINMVQIEYNIRQYTKNGYEISFTPLSDIVNSVGRITSWPIKTTTLSYQVTVKKNGVEKSLVLGCNINGKATI